MVFNWDPMTEPHSETFQLLQGLILLNRRPTWIPEDSQLLGRIALLDSGHAEGGCLGLGGLQ